MGVVVDLGFQGISEFLVSLKEDIIPWRRENAKDLAALQQCEMRVEIRIKRAQAAEQEARTQELRAKVQHQELENEKLRLEVLQRKLITELLSKLEPGRLEHEIVVWKMIQSADPWLIRQVEDGKSVVTKPSSSQRRRTKRPQS